MKLIRNLRIVASGRLYVDIIRGCLVAAGCEFVKKLFFVAGAAFAATTVVLGAGGPATLGLLTLVKLPKTD